MKGYMSVKDIAGKWGVSARWVIYYIQHGRIPGVERFGKCWAIPEDAKKPERMRTGPKKSSLDSDSRIFFNGREFV